VIAGAVNGVAPVPPWSRILLGGIGQQRQDDAALAAWHTLKAALDAVPLAVVTLTPAGKVGLWSRGAERMFGWRSDEVEGRDPPFLAPEHVAQAESLRQRILAGNEVQNQPAQRRDKAGEAREVAISARPLRDPGGAIIGMISVLEDVTDRRRLDLAREEQRARLAAVLDAVADPIVSIDEAGLVTSFNRAAERVFGYAAGEVMGRNLSMLMPEPYHARHDGYLRRYHETGIAHLIGRSRNVTGRRKDGRTFPAEITIGEAWLEERRIFAGIVRDRSGWPQPDAGTKSTAAGEGKAAFLSRITHDLRQPLHALSLMTGALERRIADPETREIVDHLAGTVRSTQGLFENIVEWTRLESGLIAGVPSAAPVGEILAPLAREFASEAERRGLRLRCVPSHVIIACDPALVRRILRQFLDNALKFTPKGGIVLGIRRHGPMLRLVVADSGIGIPPDQHGFVFTENGQLDAGREAGGLGLGLAIARRLAELSGLTLGMRSRLGSGSSFWVEVPLASA
jgi:PAS domain S-box-containing protein